jgi:putative Holliday junction resolvase
VRILGLDVGDKRIGVAVSDELGFAAHPVDTLQRRSRSADLARIEERVREFDVRKIVVGLPVNMDGSSGPQAESVLEFIQSIRSKIPGVQVETWDERLTTRAAERLLVDADLSRRKRKGKIDRVASVLILQGYLDSLPRDAANRAV